MEFHRSFWNITWSRKYERYNRHHKEIWDAILKIVPLDGEVCDLGCGPCVMYEGKNVKLTGVDFSEEALKQAKLHYPQGSYVCADSTATGLPSGKYDVVLMLGLLDYFENIDEVLHEAERIAKPNGSIIGTLLHGFQGHDWSMFPKITSNWHLYLHKKADPSCAA